MSQDLWSKNTLATELGVGHWKIQYAVSRGGIEPALTLPSGHYYGPQEKSAILAELADIKAGVEARRKVPA